jgi:glycosyltransferase involved in cell wall biosynthesis
MYGLEAGAGGALKHLSYLVCNLDKRTHDVTVVVSRLRSPEECDMGAEKMRLSGARVVFVPMTTQINPIRDLVSLIRIIRLLSERNFDIVHAHSSKAGVLFRLAAWIQRVPMVLYTPHCFYFQSQQHWIKRYLYYGIERLLSMVTDYIVVSDCEARILQLYPGYPQAKVRYINNAIKFSDYPILKTVREIKHELHIGLAQVVIAGIGRLEKQKDWGTYMRVAKYVVGVRPNTTFLIVGSGSERKKIDLLIAEFGLGKNIICTGHVTQVEKIYSVADIFVSTTLWEGLPYVFLEAMRYQKPIVTTHHGNDQVVVDNQTGIICPCGDYHAIANSIIRLIDNKHEARTFGKNGYHHMIKNYNFEKSLEKHNELYLRVKKV